MKKLGIMLVTLLVLVIIIGSVGCGGQQPNPTPSLSPSQTPTPSPTPTLIPTPTLTPKPTIVSAAIGNCTVFDAW